MATCMFLLFSVICLTVDVTVSVKFACGNDSVVAVCECTEHLGFGTWTVNCTNRGLMDWPKGIPTNTTILYIDDNKLREIDDDAFLRLPRLRSVYVSNNLLKKLPKFPNTILSIYANDNSLTDISTSFNDLPVLSNLFLDDNNITTLKNSTFKGSPSLNQLLLRRNSLRCIEPFTFVNTSLSSIRLQMINELQELPENSFALSGDKDTADLILSANPNLKRIFTGTFKYINTWSNIFLDDNNIQRIPSGAFQGGHLREINLNNNNISFIHKDAFIGLQGLDRLILVSNQLMELPIAVYNLPLDLLDLSWNYLESLGDRQLSPIKIIVINKNNIQSISKNNFGDMESLQVLMLIHNNITFIEEGAFSGTKLHSLFLYGNGLTNVTYETFNVNKRTLTELYLFDNHIEEMEKNALKHMSTSGSVYMDCDSLRSIPSTIGQDINTYCVTEGTVIDIGLSIEEELLETIGSRTGLVCDYELQTCRPCKEGTYQLYGQEECFLCPPGGFYQDRLGITERGDYTNNCKQCPIGSFSSDAGAPSIADCHTCPSGTKTNKIAKLNACDCLYHFHRTDRYGACRPCPKGVICEGGYQKLKKGYWWSWEFSCDYGALLVKGGTPPCLKAYNEFISRLKNDTFPDDNPNILKNAIYTGELPEVHMCPLGKKSCDGGVDANCSDGYTGWLCAACADNFYELFNECRKCQGIATTVIILIGITTALVGVTCLICRLERRNRENTSTRLDSLVTHLKIAINFYQVLGILSEVNEIHWPEHFESVGQSLQYMDVIRYIHILSPRCFMPGSWNAYSTLHVAMATPVVIVVSVSVIYFIWYIWNKYHGILTERRIREKCLCITMMLLYLTYANTCADVMAVGPWSIRSFKVTEDGNVNKSILTSDYSIDLENNAGATYRINKTLVYVSLIYVVGFPLAVVLILYGRHRHGDAEDNGRERPVTIGLRFFYGQYKSKFWFWELLELFNKAILAFIANFKDDASSNMAYSLFFTVIFIVLHLYLEPMKEKSEHRFQLLTLVFIVVNLSVGAIVDMDQTQYTKDKTTDLLHRITPVILLLLNISIILVVIVDLLKKVKHDIWGGLNRPMELRNSACDNSIDHDEQLLQD